MSATRYTWDDEKAAENERKHGVDFTMAAEVFTDPGRVEGYDISHSEHEDRWTAIGYGGERLLYVVYTMRPGNVRRIITARKANKNEQRRYYQANS